jgi:NADPH2 dehydrogenase
MITDPIKANEIIINNDADMVAMARAFLTNPRWVWDAAKILKEDIEVPPQYARRF